MECPACASGLTEFKAGPARIRPCPKCGGVWVPGEGLRVFANYPEQYVSADMKAVLTADGAPAPAAHERKCPACRRILNSHRYAYSSGIIIDSCPADDGVWLDAGELRAVREFARTARGELDADQLFGVWASGEIREQEERLESYHGAADPNRLPDGLDLKEVWNWLDIVFILARIFIP